MRGVRHRSGAKTRRKTREKKVVAVSPDFWPIITMGSVILIAIATSHRSLRRELNERIAETRRELGERITSVQQELGGRIDGLSDRVDGLSERVDGLTVRVDGLSERVDGLSDRLGDVRERLGRVEGLLEGVELKRNWADKGRDDGNPVPALPRP